MDCGGLSSAWLDFSGVAVFLLFLIRGWRLLLTSFVHGLSQGAILEGLFRVGGGVRN